MTPKALKSLSIASLAVHRAALCNEYVRRFCEKQDMQFEFWVGGEGGIALVSDFYLGFDDIVTDLEAGVEKGEIIKWYDHCLERHSKNETAINYQTWLKGFRG